MNIDWRGFSSTKGHLVYAGPGRISNRSTVPILNVFTIVWDHWSNGSLGLYNFVTLGEA